MAVLRKETTVTLMGCRRPAKTSQGHRLRRQALVGTWGICHVSCLSSTLLRKPVLTVSSA